MSWNDEEYVRQCYLTILLREPTPENIAFYAAKLVEGKTRQQLVYDFIRSSEFILKCSKFNDKFHKARVELIRTKLPKASVLVDLGGASRLDLRGALLAMGYPHRPTVLNIVDLPIADRIEIRDGNVKDEPERDFLFEGTEIRYVHTSMTNLAAFETGSVDLVWSGESIEHITEADAEIVIAEAWRILARGGVFALDTPNRLATELLAPDGFIHIEHKIEYQPVQLLEKIKRQGFEIREFGGLMAMPKSIEAGRLVSDEIMNTYGLNSDPENAYAFYVIAER